MLTLLPLAILGWFGPTDGSTDIMTRLQQTIAAEALDPLAAEWKTPVLDPLREALGRSARADDPRAVWLIGTTHGTFQVGLRVRVGARPGADLTPEEARDWLGAPAQAGPITVTDAERVHDLLRTSGLPPTGGLTGAQLDTAYLAVAKAVARAAFRGVKFEDGEGGPYAVVRVAIADGHPSAMSLAELRRVVPFDLASEPGDELLFTVRGGLVLKWTLDALAAGSPPAYGFQSLPTDGGRALKLARRLADGAPPAKVPTHTTAAGVRADRWRRLWPERDALVAGVPGERADAIWTALAAAAEKTGWHPVVLGPLDQMASLIADGRDAKDTGLAISWHYGGTPESALAAAGELTLDDYLKTYGAELRPQADASPSPSPASAPWPLARWNTTWTADGPTSTPAGVHRWVYLMLVPADAPWKVPAWPATHTAGEATPSNTALVLLARHLHETHRAVVYGAGPGKIAFRLPATPQPAAMKALHTLVRRLCPDTYADESAATFAAERARGDDLYFWWD